MTFFGCLWRTCFVRGSLASGHVVVRYSGKIHGAQFVQTSRLKMNIQIQFVIFQYIHPCQWIKSRKLNAMTFWWNARFCRRNFFLAFILEQMSAQNAQSEEYLLTVKRNCSWKSNLLRAKICSKFFAHSRNLLTEFARSIDGSTWWLNVSHHSNRSTAGAHHSMVSVVMAGTCWAGPSTRHPWSRSSPVLQYIPAPTTVH